ncbi:unnamed protein product [Polarella glacialis]|uniref:PDZ domain-containing protein n=1 Tax=Polarella glacialis TaxID=89957 RepID=A0A813FF38_POLGL|nr:unnamed protein product [Polarella glacialis]
MSSWSSGSGLLSSGGLQRGLSSFEAEATSFRKSGAGQSLQRGLSSFETEAASFGSNHLASIGRKWDVHPEEHRHLPTTGLSSTMASTPSLAASGLASASSITASLSSVASAGLAATQGSGSQVRITVPQLMEDGRLGLTIQNCWVSAITDPRSSQWGWIIGDHILQVNGHPVSDMQQLSLEISRAVDTHKAVSHPVVFDVWRPSASPITHLASPSSLPSPSLPSGMVKRRRDGCGECGSCETSYPGGSQLPVSGPEASAPSHGFLQMPTPGMLPSMPSIGHVQLPLATMLSPTVAPAGPSRRLAC